RPPSAPRPAFCAPVGGTVQGPVAHHGSGCPCSKRRRRDAQKACADQGLQLHAPTADAHKERFRAPDAAYGVGLGLRLAVPQMTVGERRLDTEHGLQLGSAPSQSDQRRALALTLAEKRWADSDKPNPTEPR